jgi:hypothetical protein
VTWVAYIGSPANFLFIGWVFSYLLAGIFLYYWLGVISLLLAGGVFSYFITFLLLELLLL